jgi:hypothetical protein
MRWKCKPAKFVIALFYPIYSLTIRGCQWIHTLKTASPHQILPTKTQTHIFTANQKKYTVIFSFLPTNALFISVFLFSSHYTCFGRDPAINRGTLISSLHCSLVHLVLSQNRYTVWGYFFSLTITGIQSFFKLSSWNVLVYIVFILR